MYKQNNPQFAQQGAVKSSLRTFKLALGNLTTVKNAKTTIKVSCPALCPYDGCPSITLSGIASQSI